MRGTPECDMGCTRPVPTDNPLRLERLGWVICGPWPDAIWHPAHSAAQPFLVRPYTEWRRHADTRYYCATCFEEKGLG